MPLIVLEIAHHIVCSQGSYLEQVVFAEECRDTRSDFFCVLPWYSGWTSEIGKCGKYHGFSYTHLGLDVSPLGLPLSSFGNW